ncbi:hypothetical protein [uncultured Imperialibacter sp.]|tara:strand:- start:3446 stop:3595 length:150 start_codon:yes stop_codon:yes gene_type:complete
MRYKRKSHYTPFPLSLKRGRWGWVVHDGENLFDYLLEIGAASSRAKPWK